MSVLIIKGTNSIYHIFIEVFQLHETKWMNTKKVHVCLGMYTAEKKPNCSYLHTLVNSCYVYQQKIQPTVLTIALPQDKILIQSNTENFLKTVAVKAQISTKYKGQKRKRNIYLHTKSSICSDFTCLPQLPVCLMPICKMYGITLSTWTLPISPPKNNSSNTCGSKARSGGKRKSNLKEKFGLQSPLNSFCYVIFYFKHYSREKFSNTTYLIIKLGATAVKTRAKTPKPVAVCGFATIVAFALNLIIKSGISSYI